MSGRLRAPRWVIAGLVSAACAAVAVPAVRTPLLRATGEALVANDAVTPVDVIVLTPDSGGAGILEAADLVRRGIATRVAVFADPPNTPADREFLRRIASYDDTSARAAAMLVSLGVTGVERLPGPVLGTEDVGRLLPAWFERHAVRSAIVVGTSDHSRRLRRVLRRSMNGHRTTVLVRAAKYSQFDPDQWWHTRSGLRTGIVELEKLLLDLVLHPVS
jgi:hypothetical protein